MRIRGQKRRGGVLAGCLIALGVVLVLLVAGGIYVAMNWRDWAASAGEAQLTSIIDEADLSDEDKIAMKSEVSELMLDFREKRVSLEELGRVAEEVAESPVLAGASIMFVDAQYIQKSELPPEEKAEGSKQLSRFMRGLFDKSISQTKIDDVTEPIHAQDASNAININTGNLNLRLKQPEDVSIEELQAFLTNCETVADEAGVPDEHYRVNMSQEFSDAIDRALGRAPAEPPALEADPEAESDSETADAPEPPEESGGG